MEVNNDTNKVMLIEHPLEEYSIVYQKDAVLAKRLALLLSEHIRGAYGISLQVKDDAAEELGCEILVGETCRTHVKLDKNEYIVCATKHKLKVVFESSFAYEYALSFLKEKIFSRKARNLVNGDVFAFNIAQVIDEARRPAIVKKGDIRVIVNNIYGAYKPLEERMLLLKKVYDAYEPDILCFQESGPRARRCESTLMSELWKSGYREVRFEEILNNNYNPVFYRADRFEVIDSGYHLFNGANNFESKSLSFAVFFDKKLNRKIGAYSHHYYYTGDDIGKQTRMLNAGETREIIGKAYEKHRCPFVGGGDINCLYDSDPYKYLIENGFVDTYDSSPIKMNIGTCHNEATVNESLGILTPVNDVKRNGDYRRSIIDFLFTYGEHMRVVNHGVIADEAMLAGTDHAAVYADLCY